MTTVPRSLWSLSSLHCTANFRCTPGPLHRASGLFRRALKAQRCAHTAAAEDLPSSSERQRPDRMPKAVVPPTFAHPPLAPPSTLWENGAILIDKPSTWTSFDVCGKLRRVLNVKKVGHAGTLDPLATGLLIICTGKGTKSIDGYQALEKEYTGVLRLGEGTPSYDVETEVCERKLWDHILDDDLVAAARSLTGDILQTPPMFSAIRIGGERLYKLARAGLETERPARPVSVALFEVSRTEEDPQHVRFRIVCSKGTYVRSLVHDLGVALQTCAVMTALRREAIGEYRVDNAWQLQDLIAAVQQTTLAELQTSSLDLQEVS